MELLMGNEAMALAAMDYKCEAFTGYPGTPSSEILEYVSKKRKKDMYVEWSVNEKVAAEISAGFSIAGKRSLVTMKQVGLNVGSDPLMNLSYIGVNAGLVFIVCDDPGPISSQTEQDTRNFGPYSKVIILDPSSVQEAYDLVQLGFFLSEEYNTPVIVRPTTRICHSHGLVKRNILKEEREFSYEKSPRWAIFPALSYKAHIRIEKRNKFLEDKFSDFKINKIEGGESTKGLIASGISYNYLKESLDFLEIKNPRILKITSAYPFPKKDLLKFLQGLDEILVVEELSSYLEDQILKIIGEEKLPINVHGKGDFLPLAGEYSKDIIDRALVKFYKLKNINLEKEKDLNFPKRPAVLCPGCPHRSSFLAIKDACKGKKTVFNGDIGCYTLANAKPIEMLDTCLCMGASVSMSQAFKRVDKDILNIAFIGDSTFFHSGLTSVVNAVYNKADLIVVLLDNSTTAMTGKQDHPGTGMTLMGEKNKEVDPKKVLEALGCYVIESDPFDFEKARDDFKSLIGKKGVRVIIYKRPCVKISKSDNKYEIIQDSCTNCKLCLKKTGCPALVSRENFIEIDQKQCAGCGLCKSYCKFSAIKGVFHD